MLEAFKAKPYDIAAVYASWPNAPIFQGNPDDDPLIWLAAIKAGCVERKVPKEHWHRIARHYLAPKPRQRLEELGKVMQNMSGNHYSWTWKKFKVAMQNLGWGPAFTQNSATHSSTTSSGSPSGSAPVTPPPSDTKSAGIKRPTPKKQGSWWILGNSSDSSSLISSKKDHSSDLVMVAKSNSTTSLAQVNQVPASGGTSVSAPNPGTLTTVSSAPAWMVNACTALDFLTQEHPRVMSAMSAILITIGAIPAIPAISAGAGGVALASGAAQAAGAIALGVGHWLKAQQEGQVKIAGS